MNPQTVSVSLNSLAKSLGKISAKTNRSALYIAIVLITILFIFIFATKSASKSSSTLGLTTDQKIATSAPKATLDINKDFTFSLKNESGAEVGKIKYTIQSAELRDDIIIKGQKAAAVLGRTFLIVNLKITNDTASGVNINTRNYIRLSLNGNDKELLAPEIHNDPVEVQAISTKLGRAGFTINDSDKDLKLRVGEINGNKTDIPLKLSNR